MQRFLFFVIGSFAPWVPFLGSFSSLESSSEREENWLWALNVGPGDYLQNTLEFLITFFSVSFRVFSITLSGTRLFLGPARSKWSIDKVGH